MRSTLLQAAAVFAVLGLSALAGCSEGVTPTTMVDESVFSAETVVAQDLIQLSEVGIPGGASDGIFSIGWNQFVGPAILNAGTIGKAFAVVHDGTVQPDTRPGGVDIGEITLSYGSGSTALTKHVSPSGNVLYSTFARGLHNPGTLPDNIPFISGAVYRFEVSGSAAFRAGSFEITAPASLLDITSQTDGDTFNPASDLTVSWTGGTADTDVLLRVVPHLRPPQLEGRGRGGPRGPGRHGSGMPPDPPMPREFGPEFEKGFFLTVPNTGSYTIEAARLQELLGGGEATEVMVGVAQAVRKDVTHDGKSITLLLRNGDRVVLKVQQ